jgi:FkbM family methyltransferase
MDVSPLEFMAVALGRNLSVRGVERLLRAVYPCSPSARRFVRAVRYRKDGLRMELDSRSWVEWNLLFRGDYEPHLTRLWSRIVPPGGVAIDAGANIGAHTLSLARMVGARGRVLAFEPNPIVRSALIHNLALNGLEHVTVYDCALGSRAGRSQLRVPSAGTEEWSNMGLASLVALETPHDLIDVEIRTLDEVVDALRVDRIDVVKIDVQGYEMETLRGMRSCLARFRPVVVFEYDAWAWSQANVQPAEVFDYLRAAGYALFRIDGRSEEPQPLLSDAALPPYLDLVAVDETIGPRVFTSLA